MVIVRFSRVWRAVLRMGHPLVRRSLQMMTQDGGMTAQLQGDHEGCRGSTTKLGGMWVFLPELEATYRRCMAGQAPTLPPLHFRYRDYIARQRHQAETDAWETQLAFW